MRPLTVAATQFACTWDLPANADGPRRWCARRRGRARNIVLMQELFETPYFCNDQHPDYFDLAQPLEGHPLIARFAALAAELGVVLPGQPISNGRPGLFQLGRHGRRGWPRARHYRKSHIPQGPGYEEKYYFSPGDTGFKVWDTAFGRIGVGICWDQWFPEAARAMALMGAEMLLYPTAIGSEPPAPGYDSQPHWETVMRGHAAANIVPVVASNRIGTEAAPDGRE